MNTDTPTMNSMFGGEASGGFFDLPIAQPGEVENADIVVMGIPSATPYSSVGAYCAEAPDAIRDALDFREYSDA